MCEEVIFSFPPQSIKSQIQEMPMNNNQGFKNLHMLSKPLKAGQRDDHRAARNMKTDHLHRAT